MPQNFIFWNVDPVIISVFGIPLKYYSLLFVGGLLLCIYLLGRIFKDENIPPDYLEKLSIYGVVGIFAGARLGHCLFYEPGYYLAHPLEIVLPIQHLATGGYKFIGFQGLASHGAALGLLLALLFFSRKTKLSLIRILDLVAVVAPLECCFIRLGNLMNSEINGMPSTVPWSFIFAREDNIPRHPAQLYEALTYLLIFILMIVLYKKYRPKLQNGFSFGLTVSLIFIARFFIEFIKERQVPFESRLPIDMGQILSIPYIILGIIFLVYGIVKTKKQTAQ